MINHLQSLGNNMLKDSCFGFGGKVSKRFRINPSVKINGDLTQYTILNQYCSNFIQKLLTTGQR